jgi:hypothetical protein
VRVDKAHHGKKTKNIGRNDGILALYKRRDRVADKKSSYEECQPRVLRLLRIALAAFNLPRAQDG